MSIKEVSAEDVKKQLDEIIAKDTRTVEEHIDSMRELNRRFKGKELTSEEVEKFREYFTAKYGDKK
jgi:hypothetical protein